MIIEVDPIYMFVIIMCIIVGYEIGKKSYDILKNFIMGD